MHVLKPVVSIPLLLLITPVPAQAVDLNYYLKFEGIAGESTSPAFRDAIDVDSFHWGITNAVNHLTGGGAGASKPLPMAFTWTQTLDKSTPPLLVKSVLGQHAAWAELIITEPAGSRELTRFKLRFDEVFVTRLELRSSEALPAVSGDLGYGSVTMTYYTLDPKGSLGPAVVGGFDFKRGEEIRSFSGDPAALAGLALLTGASYADGNLQFVAGIPEPSTWATFAVGAALLAVGVRKRQTKGMEA